MTIIPIVICAFGTVTKGLFKGLEDLEVGGPVETIQTARILRRVMETPVKYHQVKLMRKTWVNNYNGSPNPG